MEEPSRASNLAQRKSDIKAAVAVHKSAGAKRMVRVFVSFWFLGHRFSVNLSDVCVLFLILFTG